MPLSEAEAESFLAEFQTLLSKYLATDARASGVPTPSSLGAYTVVGREVLPDGFDYRWPDRTTSTKYRPTEQVPTARYTVRTVDGDYSLLIGAELGGRRSHGRDGRGRIVVFVRRGAVTGGLYPLVEFAEIDTRGENSAPLFAAGIFRPDKPRSLTTSLDLDLVKDVPHLRDADIRRADEVYHGMNSGPSLRLVVDVTDVETMLLHALWVGGLRGGGRLPRPA